MSPVSSFFQNLCAALIAILSCLASFFQQQNPPAFFNYKLFVFSMTAILAFLQEFSPGMANTGVLYYVAVASFLLFVLAFATVKASSSRLPRWATNSLRWCVFFTASLSFGATASFLFRDSVRLVIFVLILIIISAYVLLHCVHETQLESRQGWWHRCQLFFKNIWMRLAHGFPQQPRQRIPL